jgi:predicted RNA-binding protein with PUA-like domain
MNYRLIKSEPYKYSRDQFFKDGRTMRDGVRNYQARNNLNAMRVWDLCFWYHSNEGKEIVGIAQVSRESYPDPTAGDDPKSRVVVDVVPYTKLNHPISLEQIKSDPHLSSISLLKQQRLSVAPITPEEYAYIIQLSQ